jgi:ribonuclease HI
MSPAHDKFIYAVHKGHKQGIYLTWDECQAQVAGYPGAIFRKCRGIDAAKYFAKHGKLQTEEEKIKSGRVDKSELSRVSLWHRIDEEEIPDPLIVYVDGSAKKDANGFLCGGYGVWFGDGDSRNTKEAFKLPNPTNQRCELMAAIKAIELCSEDQEDLDRELVICSDSRYVWNCLTSWVQSWKKNGWKTRDGSAVKNRSLIEKLWDLCQARKPGGVSIMWTPGHSGVKGNEEADKLADATMS